MATDTHTIMGGKVHLYRRGDGDHWHCSTFLKGKKHRKSAKEDSLSLRERLRRGLVCPAAQPGPSRDAQDREDLEHAAGQFLKEYEIITEGHRSPRWVEGHRIRLRLHLLPFFGDLGVSEVTAGKVRNTACTARPPHLSAVGAPSKRRMASPSL